MLISIFFVMPDSLMLYLFITGINANIHFAQLEKKGNKYQRPLEKLLELLPQHQFLAQSASEGKLPGTEELSRKEAEIDAAFDDLQGVDERIGADLQFTHEGLAKRKREHFRAPIVRKEWQDLVARLSVLDSAAQTREHLHLIADIRTMISHAGDLSNLILDPDLDSYYLMDATLLALPQTQDRLATAMSYGGTFLRQTTISVEERQRLAICATFLQEADLDRVRGSVQTALNEDPNFYQTSATLQERVPSALKEYTEAAEQFIALTEQVANSENSGISVETFLAAGNKARQSSFELWRIVDEEFDILLDKRIEAYEGRRLRSLIVTGFALLAAIGFVSFITRSISGPLRQQANDLLTVNENLQNEIAEHNRTEAELRRSESQLAAAQKIARIGSWEWDLISNQLTWSDENYRIHGMDRHSFEASYETALQLAEPSDRERSDAAFKQALLNGKPFSFEQRIRRHDGTQRILHQRGDFVSNSEGNLIKVFGTAQDVTERKQAEIEIERINKQLLDVSRRAGMTEVATSVLHNVGNVLNSVNVSCSVIAENVRKSSISNVIKTADLLKQHSGDLSNFLTGTPMGQKLPAFLERLGERLVEEQTLALEELRLLGQNIEHIKEIVAMQQNYANVGGVRETLPIEELVEDALRMNGAALIRHRIEIIRDFQKVPDILVEKHKVLQILVNLVRNAKHALTDSERVDKQLTLRISADDEHLSLSVVDNGIGIAPENMTRIFAHGFTTKIDGHGFGLHSGVLAAKEMGGSLIAQSDGPGTGATFTLKLPLGTRETPLALS